MGCTLTRGKHSFAILGATAALFFGSFGDEAAQIMFALSLADGSASSSAQVSSLLAAGLIGGISAGVLSSRVVTKLGARRLIVSVLIAESCLIACASFASSFIWYLCIAAVLGCLGSMLWTAVMIAIPSLEIKDLKLENANRVVQTVRNLGYVVGPLLGSTLFAWSSGTKGLLVLALGMLVVAICLAFALPSLLSSTVAIGTSANTRKTPDIAGLFRTPGVFRAILPLIFTVLVTSALNVLLIVRVRSELEFSATSYGTIVAALSVGLVAGPALFAGCFSRIGAAPGASAAAATIGLGIIFTGSMTELWQLIIAAILIGIANGVQNTLMSTFIMERVDAEHRAFRMPAYILIIQCSVFAGFIGAAFINVSAAGSALVAAGIVAIVVGIIGIVINRPSKTKSIMKGIAS